MVKEYCQRSTCLIFLYVLLVEMKSCFHQEWREHDELALIPDVSERIEVNGTNQCVKDKWNYVIPLPT